jgi:gliding motility-associated-like protein
MPLSDATISQAGPFCLNDAPVNLTAANMGGTWSGTGITDGINGTFNPSVAAQGIHTIIYTISGMCGDSDTIDILVNTVPNISLEATDESCSGANDGSIDLTVNGGTLPYLFNWNNGETTEDIFDLVPAPYIIIVTDSNGCSVTDNIDILGSSILCYEPNIYIPNIFSPNGDKQNDVLYVRGKGIKEFVFVIYDRWGEEIFKTKDQDKGWDGTYKGKKLNTSVFTYYIYAVMINDEIIKKKGAITLIR